MIIVAGTFRIAPHLLDEARPVMARMIGASRKEPGCLQYAYAIDISDDGLVHVSEAWSDRAALNAHLDSQHLADWRNKFDELGISERKLNLYAADSAEPV